VINPRFIIRLRQKRLLVHSSYIKRDVIELLINRRLMYIRERSLDGGVAFVEYLSVRVQIRTAGRSIIRMQHN
jgi:hypothetical protein